jgi:two-component system LytT family response regulator
VTLRAVVVDDEPLPRQRVLDLVRADPRLDLVGEATDGRTALDVIVERVPDVVFLDIQIPELDGFQVISALDLDTLPAFVFVTAFDEYAIRAFEVDAFDYLLKPITADRFGAAVTRVMTRLERSEPPRDAALRALASRAVDARPARAARFVARRGGKHYFVRADEIDWIEAVGNYVRLQTGTRSHLIRDTMKGIEAKLDPAEFVRVHRSAIVALERIESIEAREHGEYLVTMRSGTRIVSSRGYSERIREILR